MTISKAMSSLFSCFRIKDDHHRARSQRFDRVQEVEGSRNRLSALFLSEELEETPRKNSVNAAGLPQVEKGLKDEAKFLKACGTIPETPAEIRKASGKFKGGVDLSLPKFDAHKSVEKVQLDKNPDRLVTPVKLNEEWTINSSSKLSPSSCISDIDTTGRVSIGSSDSIKEKTANTVVNIHANRHDENLSFISPSNPITNDQGRNKSVRFLCNADATPSASSSGDINQNSKKCGKPGNQSESKPSPNPTPLKLDDLMQTPGTAYPSMLDSIANGKARIRSQYVYSVPNPMDNSFQMKETMEYDDSSQLLSSEIGESLSKHESATSLSEGKETSKMKESMVDTSLFARHKPSPTIGDENNKITGAGSASRPPFGRTPCDRPIIGLVAAHWNEDDIPRVSPKWWDGHGIPNSTNKYKEDQKVSWHATPFEERLEKALSEESSNSQRKHISRRPILFEENEENDTAISQQQHQHFAHSKSALSC